MPVDDGEYARAARAVLREPHDATIGLASGARAALERVAARIDDLR